MTFLTGLMLFLLFVILLGWLYIWPSIVATRRKHPRMGSVCALNLLLGWTIVGWFAAMAWARTAPPPLPRRMTPPPLPQR